MCKRARMRDLLLLLALLYSQHASSNASEWCYASEKSHHHNCAEPANWAKADNACGGLRQSPIQIDTKSAIINEELKLFSFRGYNEPHDVEVKNTGHTVQVDLSSDISISRGGLSRQFRAVNFHFHWGDGISGGSEHMLNNVRYPAELHIVHMRVDTLEGPPLDEYNLAVLGFPLKEVPQDNPQYTPLIDALNKIPYLNNKTRIINMTLNNLITSEEKRSHYFRYNGSLTTPGCNESVIWTVFEDEIQLSKTQLAAFSENLFFPDERTKMHNNYRPVQGLNGRVIFRSSARTARSNASICRLRGAMIFISSALFYLVTERQH